MTVPGPAIRFLDPVNPADLFERTAALLHALAPRPEPVAWSRFPDLGGTYHWWAPPSRSDDLQVDWGFSVIAGLERDLSGYDAQCRPEGVWPGEAFIEVSVKVISGIDAAYQSRPWGTAATVFIRKVIARWAWERGVRTVSQHTGLTTTPGQEWFDYASNGWAAWGHSDQAELLLEAMKSGTSPLDQHPM